MFSNKCTFIRLSLEERYKLIMSVGEECITDKELYDLLQRKKFPICYDGFEPSGRMHIAQVYFYMNLGRNR